MSFVCWSTLLEWTLDEYSIEKHKGTKKMLEGTFDALCTQCNFGIEQVEYISMIFGSNRQETYTMLKREQSVDK
jgi:hypothetical protein